MDFENRNALMVRRFSMQCVSNPFHATGLTLYIPKNRKPEVFRCFQRGVRTDH